MTYQRIQKSASWTPQVQKKTPSLAPPPIVVQQSPLSRNTEVPMPEYQPLPADYKIEDHPLMRQFNSDRPIQTKLTIGTPGDKYEQEADTVARKVVSEIEHPDVQTDTEKTELQRKPAIRSSVSYLQQMSAKNAHISPFSAQVQRKENGMRIFRDIDPSQVSSGNTKINTADISLEKIGHGLIYYDSLTDTDKEWLETNGFEPRWYPNPKGDVTIVPGGKLFGEGVTYGLLLPNEAGKKAGKVPVLAFRGTSDFANILARFGF